MFRHCRGFFHNNIHLDWRSNLNFSLRVLALKRFESLQEYESDEESVRKHITSTSAAMTDSASVLAV